MKSVQALVIFASTQFSFHVSIYSLENLNRGLALTCCLDLLPISFIGGAGMKYMISLLEPDYKIPSTPVVRTHQKALHGHQTTSLESAGATTGHRPNYRPL